MPRQRSVNRLKNSINLSNKLIKLSGNIWEFANETVLENFVWSNLTHLFSLIPLERQHLINGERCDIIAVSNEGQLVIMELKNTQDRGIVQQLTRYYASIIEIKPFNVDYNQPVKLVAITRKFHKHNFIDREYSKLAIEFIEFKIEEKKDEGLYLRLNHLDNNETKLAKIDYQPQQLHKLQDHLPPVPNLLTKIMKPCSAEQKQIILQVRERILCFHERIQEIKGANCVKYGRGGKICAEIRPNNSKIPGFVQPVLFLYLPIPDKYTLLSLDNVEQNNIRKHPLGRMQISSADTRGNWNTFTSLGVAYHIPPGKRSIIKSYGMNSFSRFITSQSESDLYTLVDLALLSWLDRL
ncbi:MAG: hypothetical protein DSM106950_04820 [Stigonema ocellatum SAG 48.90 = DSM 106950]|nr:hypothetical protein [Stigonema ocellatum SAG 48.90 = DSM 106950]